MNYKIDAFHYDPVLPMSEMELGSVLHCTILLGMDWS